MTLKRATLAEQAYQEIRSRIVSGRLAAGHRLLPEELACELAISPTPVKEAIASLERDGLVEGTARHVSTVRRFRAVDVHHIYAARTLLELHALRHGFETGAFTPAKIAAVEEVFARQVAHGRRPRRVVFVEAVRLDLEFHEVLVEVADNPVIAAWHRSNLAQIQTILTYSIANYDATRAHREHAAIIAALKSGDADRVEVTMRGHLDPAKNEILSRTPGLAGRDAA